ncbi:MAG: hypothetical protein WCC21_09380 [Candidatus Acidiferrales bacterium]
MTITRSVSKVELLITSLPLSARLQALATNCLALLILALFAASLCHAQTTYTAASSNESDVQTAVNKVSPSGGDTVNVPCSPATPVWTTALTSSNRFTLNFQGSTPNAGAETFGSGMNCVTIVDNNTGGSLFVFRPTYSATNNILTVQNVNIDPIASTTSLGVPISIGGTCTSSGCPLIRLNNIYFGKNTQWEYGKAGSPPTLIVTDNVFGVIDHNTEPTGTDAVFLNMNNSAYLGVGTNGDNSWAQPDTFGGTNNLYVENNSIYVTRSATDAEVAPAGGAVGGSRQVDRFNQITSNNGFGVFGLHGLDTDGRPRSGRQLEVYGNSITCTNSSCNIIAGYRGGTGFTFGNTITNTGTGFFNSFFFIAVYRIVYDSGSWGACGGLNSLDPWDSTDNTVYYTGTVTSANGLIMTDSSKTWTTNQFTPNGAPYSVYDVTQGVGFVAEITSNTANTLTIAGPISESSWKGFNNGDSYEIIRARICADQGGRGQGNYISGAIPSPASALNQALDPIYEWNDSESPIRLNGNGGSDTLRTIANRDWYTDNWYGRASGPTVQTGPTAPFNGTGSSGIGVGFGTLANRPSCSSACIVGAGYWATDQGNWNQSGSGTQGILYSWSGSAWAQHYEPYTYPHPLTTGTVTTGNSPQPPTNLSATVN